jgi:uncharacterized membrane protein HdeD (DUF308 family)
MTDSFKDELSEAGAWKVALGILVIISGMLAAATPIFTFISAMYFIAIMVLAAGVFAIIRMFQDDGAGRKFLDLILGVLSIAVAILMFQSPDIATATLALWVAIWLIVRGITELVWAFQMKTGRAMLILTGIVDLFLGIVLVSMDEVKAVAVLGFYVAISLIFWGVSLIFQGALLRDVSRTHSSET